MSEPEIDEKAPPSEGDDETTGVEATTPAGAAGAGASASADEPSGVVGSGGDPAPREDAGDDGSAGDAEDDGSAGDEGEGAPEEAFPDIAGVDPAPAAGAVGERPGFRSGFVSVVGLPNVGKSTLINSFLERSLLITSFRPQTTRNEIRCILTDAHRQIVFVDTPGFVPGKQKLDKHMRKEIYRAKADVDILIYVIDAERPRTPENRNCWKALTRDYPGQKVLVLNKIDRFKRDDLIPIIQEAYSTYEPDELVPVSALKTRNLEALDEVITKLLPEGPQYYPDDMDTDRPLSFILSEFIREPLYIHTKQEIPFACAVSIDRLKETEASLILDASIIVERETQKGIVIGDGGSRIDRIRRDATDRIGAYVAPRKLKLRLSVKVQKNWRSREDAIRNLTQMDS